MRHITALVAFALHEPRFCLHAFTLRRAGHILDVKLPSRGVLRTHDEKFLRARAKGLHFYIRAAAALLTPQYRNLVDQFLCLESLRPIMFPTLCYDDDEQYITVSGRYSRAPRVHDEQAVVMRMLASSWLSFS